MKSKIECLLLFLSFSFPQECSDSSLSHFTWIIITRIQKIGNGKVSQEMKNRKIEKFSSCNPTELDTSFWLFSLVLSSNVPSISLFSPDSSLTHVYLPPSLSLMFWSFRTSVSAFEWRIFLVPNVYIRQQSVLFYFRALELWMIPWFQNSIMSLPKCMFTRVSWMWHVAPSCKFTFHTHSSKTHNFSLHHHQHCCVSFPHFFFFSILHRTTILTLLPGLRLCSSCWIFHIVHGSNRSFWPCLIELSPTFRFPKQEVSPIPYFWDLKRTAQFLVFRINYPVISVVLVFLSFHPFLLFPVGFWWLEVTFRNLLCSY